MGKLKKIIVISAIAIMLLCLMLIPIIFLSGCEAAEPSEEEYFLPTPDFTSPSEYGLNFIVDKNTFIVYVYDDGTYGGGISPYYLLDENDVPHMVKWENNEFVLLPNN